MTTESAGNLTRKRRWMIAYDISDDRHRRLIHSLLKDHGQRVQYSVFECELSKKQLQDLRARLCEYMEDGDSILWYPLCRWCQTRINWSGKGEVSHSDDFYLL